VYKYLVKQSDPIQAINRWLNCGLIECLGLGEIPSSTSVNLAASIKLRSHFSMLPDSIVKLENDLKYKKFSHPCIFEYRAWNSETMIEPDELIIDVMTSTIPTPKDVGRLIIWFIRHFENFEASVDDSFYMLRKGELENAYLSLLKQAVKLAYPDFNIRFEPWDLRRFGLLSKSPPIESKGGIWASTTKIYDPIINHLLRDRSHYISAELKDKYSELIGIRELRRWLRKHWKAKELRQRWLVITGSVRFCDDTRDLIEFDGGLVRVSSRSGRITWYGIESKRGGKDPLHSLRKRLKVLKIDAKTYSLDSHHAFVELPL